MASKDIDFKIVELILSSGTLSKEIRNDPVFHECIHELSALSMSRLSSEPSYLRDCHRRIIEENYKLAYDNYQTFIQTAECTKLIFKDFEDIVKKNENLSVTIPSFVNSCNNFVEKCRKSISMANMNSLTLKNHNQILEILEIPQLLEACIRNNYLDEALELIAHTRKWERRHQNIDIVMNVVQESRLAAQKLLDQLFQQLGGNLQLPACLKIMGYLRRMDCLPEPLLRMKFLQCRDNYLKNMLVSIPNNDPFFHATKYMEITRVNLFDIATQYRAVFNDEDVFVSNAENDSFNQSMLFSSWLVMRIRTFIISLAEDLDSIVQNSVQYNFSEGVGHSSKIGSQSVCSKIQSLLGQSMYFGLSLSRIGSDFRGLLIPMFYQTIMKYIEIRLNEITDSFGAYISSYNWSVSMEIVEINNVESAVHFASEIIRNQKSDEISSPMKLMNYPLLAVLINQILAILEDIRVCCPRVLRQRIYQSFTEAIEQVMHLLAKFYQEENLNLSVKEKQQFQTMIQAFVCVFLPHVNLCLTFLFFSDNESCRLSDQGSALDIAKLSNIFQQILPETFFMPSMEDEENQEDIHEFMSKNFLSDQIVNEKNEETKSDFVIDETKIPNEENSTNISDITENVIFVNEETNKFEYSKEAEKSDIDENNTNVHHDDETKINVQQEINEKTTIEHNIKEISFSENIILNQVNEGEINSEKLPEIMLKEMGTEYYDESLKSSDLISDERKENLLVNIVECQDPLETHNLNDNEVKTNLKKKLTNVVADEKDFD